MTSTYIKCDGVEFCVEYEKTTQHDPLGTGDSLSETDYRLTSVELKCNELLDMLSDSTLSFIIDEIHKKELAYE